MKIFICSILCFLVGVSSSYFLLRPSVDRNNDYIKLLQYNINTRDHRIESCNAIVNKWLPEIEAKQADLLYVHSKKNEILEKLGQSENFNYMAKKYHRQLQLAKQDNKIAVGGSE